MSNSLTIEYKKWGMKRVINTSIPSKCEEMDPKQFIAFAKLTFLMEENPVIKPEILAQMIKIPVGVAKNIEPLEQESITSQMDFLWDMRPVSSFLLEKMAGYYPPLPHLEGVTFGQFMYFDSYFSQYAKEKDESNLHKFIAAVYLPKGKPFNHTDIATRAKHFEKVHMAHKQAVVLNYHLIREWLSVKYPLVFPKKKQPDNTKSKKQPGWIDVFDAIVGDDIKDSEKYAEKPLHNVLRFINKKIKEGMKK